MTPVLNLALLMLAAAAVMVVVRLVKGPTDADRAVAADTLLVFMTDAAAVMIAFTGSNRYTPLLIAVSMVGFLGTVAFARFIERQRLDRTGRTRLAEEGS